MLENFQKQTQFLIAFEKEMKTIYDKVDDVYAVTVWPRNLPVTEDILRDKPVFMILPWSRTVEELVTFVENVYGRIPEKIVSVEALLDLRDPIVWTSKKVEV